MKVIKPNENFFVEYLSACKESYENNITEWMPFNPENYDVWKNKILSVYNDYENGINIPHGYPRTYTYWCIEDDIFIGEIQIRPFLTEAESYKWGHIAYAVRYSKWNNGYGTKLLNAAIKKLQEFNVSNICVVCHAENKSSIRVIEKNGGVFINTLIDEVGIEQNLYSINM
ncbi:MAG: GNAT family N-acetyltransferase [Clostridium sp.]|uniref:GNAT family N-acetyltransferase n=1 Tax=Clostridium sp. TaxID=1506 RepID=UPI002A8B035F|nr:GNAT family N-acetyltransferase [Clostridium sp.]MDY5098337.1 GNAT family N-acetyltransferase [Clostridium sp.]